MPTSPFSDVLRANLAAPTAWKFDSEIGQVFTPRWYCCNSPNSLGISSGKHPTAIIGLTPNPAFVGETVSYTGTASFDPDGSITGYAWTFQDHTPASGTASAGTLNYGTAGYYEIELIVTDGTGLDSTPARVILAVQPGAFNGYAASSSGVFYSDGASPITWTDKNAGLTVGLKPSYDVTIDPATQELPEAEKTVWRCGNGNVLFSNDGGGSWHSATPLVVTNAWSDSPAPNFLNLAFRQLLWSNGLLFVMATWQNSSGVWRSVMYYTANAPDIRANSAAAVTWTEVLNPDTI